ncbi:MAG: cyanophycin synthetase [Patescibacteria group bacterium]
MLRQIKNIPYFTVARYFRFFARIRLAAWKPRIVVITGSNGKTSALNLIEVQLGDAARYSHNANSSFGIPFDILGLTRTSYSLLEWVLLIIRAPINAWKKPYAEKIYVVEADCDRPGEGRFLSSLLMPEVVVWLSSARTHSQNFEKVVRRRGFPTIEKAIAHEFGYFAAHASKHVLINADNDLITAEMKRVRAEVHLITERELELYTITPDGSEFRIREKLYHTPCLLPKETFYAIAASVRLAEYFRVTPTTDLSGLVMPPSRSSIFRGIKDTVIIDSTYNANADSVAAVLHMIERLPSEKKWLILGDLIEQGAQEKEEHEKVARLVLEADVQKVILVGPRLAAYTLPILKPALNTGIASYAGPKEALDDIQSSLQGGEMLIFKGARFLEGVVEHLLQNKDDADKLCRRGRVWQKRRAQWGL